MDKMPIILCLEFKMYNFYIDLQTSSISKENITGMIFLFNIDNSPFVWPGVDRTSRSNLPNLRMSPSLTFTLALASLTSAMTLLHDGIFCRRRPDPVT